MGRKPQVQARVPNDVKEEIETYCDEHDLSQSDAVRRALEREYNQDGIRSRAKQSQTVMTGLTAIVATSLTVIGMGCF